MTATTSLVSEMERIANALGAEAEGAPGVSLSVVADKIAKNLGVKHDEVAILAVSTRWRHFNFLVPEALKNVGFVLFFSISSLAASTVRETRPEIETNSLPTRQVTCSESVNFASNAPVAIRKIII